MPQKISDLPELSRPLTGSDVFEMQGVLDGSNKVDYSSLSNRVVQDATIVSDDHLEAHAIKQAGNDSLGHLKLINNKLDPNLIPSTVEANITYTVGTYILVPVDFKQIITGAVPCLGGTIYPKDFTDSLALLKTRVPTSWINQDGSVTIPNFMDLSFTGPKFQNGLFRGPAVTKLGSYSAPIINLDETNNGMIPYLYCGVLTKLKTPKTYFIKDQKTLNQLGGSVVLETTTNSPNGVGFNNLTMDLTKKLSQSDLNKLYWQSDLVSSGDPLGVLRNWVDEGLTGDVYKISKYLPEKQRTISIEGKPYSFDLDRTYFILYKTESPLNYIKVNLSGSYNLFPFPGSVGTNNSRQDFLWYGMHRGVIMNSTSITLNLESWEAPLTLNLGSFGPIRVIFGVRGNYWLLDFGLSLDGTTNKVGSPFYEGFWYGISTTTETRPKVKEFMASMFVDSTNYANVKENMPYYYQGSPDGTPDPTFEYDGLLSAGCRYYGEVKENWTSPMPSQALTFSKVYDKGATDPKGIIPAFQAGTFDLSNYFSASARTLQVNGFTVIISITPSGLNIQNVENGARLTVPTVPKYGGSPGPDFLKGFCVSVVDFNNQSPSYRNFTLTFPTNSGKAPINGTISNYLNLYMFFTDGGVCLLWSQANANGMRTQEWKSLMRPSVPTNRQEDFDLFLTLFPTNWITSGNVNDYTGNIYGSYDRFFRWYLAYDK